MDYFVRLHFLIQIICTRQNNCAKKLFIPLLITHIYEKDKDLFQTSNKLLYMAYHICIICSIVFLFYRKSKILELKTYQLFFQPVIYPVVLQLQYGSDTQILSELWFLHIMSKMQLSSLFGHTELNKTMKDEADDPLELNPVTSRNNRWVLKLD